MTLTLPGAGDDEEPTPAGGAEWGSGMKALPSAGFGGGEGSIGEGVGASFCDGFTGIGSEEPGNGTTAGSDGETGGASAAAGAGAGVESVAGAGVESVAGAGVESVAGAGVGAAGDGGDGNDMGAIGVVIGPGRGGAEGVVDFGASANFPGGRLDPAAGFAGGRDGEGKLGSFVFGSSGFTELGVGPDMKGGKLGPESAASVGDLLGAGGGGAPLPEPAEMGAAPGGAAGAALGCVFCGVDGGSMAPMGRMVTGGRELVALSSFAAPFGVLPLFTSGDKDDEEGASVPPFTGAGEAVFDLVPVDSSENLPHSLAPFTGGEVGFGSTGAGAARLLGVFRFCSFSKDRLILEDTGAAPVEGANDLGAGLGSRTDRSFLELEAREDEFDLLAGDFSEPLPNVGEGGGGVFPRGGSGVDWTAIFAGVPC